MLMDHIPHWLLGRPTPPEEPAKPREQRDAQRAAASCGPKPVIEAVGDALAAVGELVSSIRASNKKTGKKKRRASSTTRKRARASISRRGVVVVEAIRIEPRAPSAPASRSASRTTRSRTRVLLRDDDPIIVAPARAAASRDDDAPEGS